MNHPHALMQVAQIIQTQMVLEVISAPAGLVMKRSWETAIQMASRMY